MKYKQEKWKDLFNNRVSWYRTQNRVIRVQNEIEVLKPFVNLHKAYDKTVMNRD